MKINSKISVEQTIEQNKQPYVPPVISIILVNQCTHGSPVSFSTDGFQTSS